MRLSDLQTKQTATIVRVIGHGSFRKRIMEMGFVKGKKVSVVLNAPLKDPIIYKIMNYEVSLRISEARMIEVITEEEATEKIETTQSNRDLVLRNNDVAKIIDHSTRKINIALVGNPNSGKTSLFNYASGGHEHVGNYGGVTVDAKKGECRYKGYTFIIYDLPGTYALSAYTPEEMYVRRHLEEHTPDVVVNVVAASNIERNLYLTTELIDMDASVVVALNMYDELVQRGSELNYDGLGRMMGVPMVPTNSRDGEGLESLFDAIIEVFEGENDTVRHIHINHGHVIESGIDAITNELKVDQTIIKPFSPRYFAIKLLEGDKKVEQLLKNQDNYSKWISIRDKEVDRIKESLNEDIESAIANQKYGFISGALREMYNHGDKDKVRTTKIIDSFVTHRLFGFPIFIALMWLMFEATFKLGAYPMEWIELSVAWMASAVQNLMNDGPLKDLITDGLISGVGGVIVFLPNIVILFLCISFMEDSGYMARAAFIMDKLMHRIGLHGKSFIPLLMGFGCNVPAIISARTIESPSSRFITILINPFISCSARLPVYLLLVGTFFPKHSSAIILGLYLFGILIAVITAKLLRKFLFKEDETPFVMELPPYRIPTIKSTLTHMWDKSWQYLRKMGGIILVASIIIWALSYFPRGDEYTTSYQHQKESYIGQLGEACSPIMEPLGFDWKINIAIITGTVAKEVVVSTLGVLYADDGEASNSVLSEKLTAINPETGKPNLSPITAITFMIFVLLYFPCIATLVAISKETGSWSWAIGSLVYSCGVAWIIAFAVRHICLLFV